MMGLGEVGFLCLLVCFSSGDRPRYQEEGSSVWIVNNTVLNSQFVMGIATVKFDQDLYVNGPTTACAFRELPCDSLQCDACDWSQQNPSGCLDRNCCGPAQGGASDEKLAVWCDSASEFTSLSFGDSETFEIKEKEWQYYRFFLPESLYCQTVAVSLRPFYGITSMVLSSQIPNPDFTSYDLAMGGPAPAFGMGVTSITICPKAHENFYTPGTYAIGVYGLTPASYRIDIESALEKQPFSPPSDRIPCSSVPESEFLRRGESGEPVVCLEDGVTQQINSSMASEVGTNQVQMIFPLDIGCQTVSFFGLALAETLEAVSFAIHCLSPVGSATTRYGNTLYTRFGSRRDQAVSFNLCFQEVTYLTCALRFYSEGQVEAIFSTEAETLKRKMVDLPHASLSFLDTLGSAIVAPFGGRAWACGDFYTANYNWLSPPSTDPLVLFPVNANLRYFYYSSDLIQEYMDAGLAKPLNKTLIVTFAMNVGNAKMMSYNTSFLSLSVLGVTNEFGEPVQLPDDGLDLNPTSVPSYALASKYIPNIAISSLPVFEPAPFCDSDKYTAFEKLVQGKIDLLLDNSLSFDEILFNKYAIDVFNSGIAGSSCNSAVSERLGSEINDVTLLDQIACLFDPVTQQVDWLFESCCNPFLELTTCCLPYTRNTTLDQFTEESDAEGCGIPECATSYLEELGYTFNNIDDRVLGCSSGIQEFPLALRALEAEDLSTYLVSCMIEAGFGARFDGPVCVEDSDCDQWTGRCNFDTGICALPYLEDMEDTFLFCFIANMSTSLENYIRETEFVKNDVPRDSPEFFERVKRAASERDCVNPHNPIDLSKRERYVWDVQRLLCKADFLGVSVDETAEMDELCPPGLCLGDFCLQNNSDCRARCDLAYTYVPLDEKNCFETACVSPDNGCDDEQYCMYCPPNEESCTVVTGVSDQETCKDSFACELPTGEVVFDLSKDECRGTTLCSSDCVGPSCVSFEGIEGVCAFEATDSVMCEAFGTTNAEAVEYDDTTCLVTSVSTEQQCVSYQAATPDIEWYTCRSFATGGTCGSTTDFTAIQRYMNCYESLWKKCETKKECLGSGYCSDHPYTSIIHSNDYPIIPQIGSCFTSGEYFGTSIPHCNPKETYFRAGCFKPAVASSVLCPPLFGNLIQQNWVLPATSEAECQNKSVKGRYGCLLPSPLDALLWILDEPECECWSGTNLYSWDWTPGTWSTGIPRSLEWKQAASKPLYELQDGRLSFVVISEWVQNNVLEKFLQVLRSEVVCTSNSVTYPMFTLVCDCLSDDEGEHCYTFANDKVILMGFSYACANEVSTIKHPSGKVAFFEGSLATGCTDVNISIIYKNWYRAPFIPPPVSFEWEERTKIGPVVNHHETTVGVLVGDGCVLSFSNPDPVSTFEVCLLFSPPDDGKYSYKVRDFGYIPNPASEFIYPLGLKKITINTRVDSIFFCAVVEYSEVPSDSDSDIYLFPILRLEDYESKDDYVTQQTKILMYFLGVCYSVLILALLYNPYQYFSFSKRGGAPLSLWMAIFFIMLCIFRAVFMFLYPNGKFEGENLSEFVVFEIPTFLLLSVVIICIYYWKKVVIKRNHFIPEKSNQFIIYIGFGFVWSLWVIVTVVYSKVILEDDGVSPCGGRVATDYSNVEDNTRTLAIVYHSVIIAITLVLSLIFLYYTVTILSTTKSRSMSGAKEYVVVIGGIICSAFILRSILFLIVLAIELASSIYLFITLFLTEVLVIAVTQFQFLKRHVTQTASRFTSRGSRSSSPKSASKSSEGTNTRPQYDM